MPYHIKPGLQVKRCHCGAKVVTVSDGAGGWVVVDYASIFEPGEMHVCVRRAVPSDAAQPSRRVVEI
jgi:hypothetical protein